MIRIITLVILLPSIVAAQIPGGWTVEDPADPAYTDRAWRSVRYINEDSSNTGPFYLVPIEVLSARVRIAAGPVYEFVVLVGQSTCLKQKVAVSQVCDSNCPLKKNPKRALYTVNLWEQPWMNFEQYNVTKIRDVGRDENLNITTV